MSDHPTAAAHPLASGLYIVATPIGNLRDMSFRALDILQAVDLVACEDSRISRRLAQVYDLQLTFQPYHDHNGAAVRPQLLARLAQGERIALISDAGTPLIADPGYKLVAAARAAGHPVFAVPGASALTAALSIAGLPTDRVLFAGFAPPKSAARQRWLAELAPIKASLVLYEAPGRLAATLSDAAAVLGDRQATLCREITKRYEETVGDSLSALAQRYQDGPPRGEIVLVIAPPAETVGDRVAIDRYLSDALKTLSVREAAAAVAWVTGAKKRDCYQRALALSNTKS